MPTFPSFSKQNLTQGISSKVDGNIDFRFGTKEEVNNNRKRIFQSLKLNAKQVVEAEQVHKTNVQRVSGRDKGKIIKGTDGLVTDDPEIALMLRLADCISIFLFDPKRPAVGLIHAGWRGTVGKILLVAIACMMREYGSNPQDLLLGLGPSLQPCCNLWQDPPIQFMLPEWKAYIKTRKSVYAVDLPGFVIDTAISAGVKKENIEVSCRCTAMDSSFFSHTRSNKTGEKEGRFAAIIGLKR